MLIMDDCIKAMAGLKENSIDALITDPPAGISFMGKAWDKGDGFIPWMTEVMREALRIMKPGAHGLVWALPRTSHWTTTALENAGFEIRDVITHLFGTGFPKSHNLGNGWGTALKPASEHWILIRKPCSEKTVAANVLKWGCGGINIDECRIEGHNPSIDRRAVARRTGHSPTTPGLVDERWRNRTSPEVYAADRASEHLGRFPANLILDEEAAAMLDEQSGVLKNGGQNYKGGNRQSMFGNIAVIEPTKFAGDSGGASRFFYVAKASKKDRNEGYEGLEVKEKKTLNNYVNPSEGRTASKSEAPSLNHHPTVKSTKLMEYLIKLITPPNGVMLDPFMGSGSTGKAAMKLGFKFIGIEKEQEYFEIAEKRIFMQSGFK